MSSGNGRAMPMLPFFPRDYLAATRHMSLAERGAYTDLLWLQWENGALADNPAILARMVGCTAEELTAVWPVVRQKFALLDGRLVNQRLEQHRAEANRIHARRAVGAAVTNAKRWGGAASQSESLGVSQSESLGVSQSESLGVSQSESLGVSHPSPSPSPSPDSPSSPSENSRRLAPTRKARPAYESQEFHQQVIAAYHELLPNLPTVKVWSPKRASTLNARIAESLRRGKPADQISYWRSVFGIVADSPHLLGDNDRAWTADLPWLLLPENFAKTIEGRYLKRQRTTLNGVAADGR